MFVNWRKTLAKICICTEGSQLHQHWNSVSQPAEFGRTLDIQRSTLIPAWWKIKVKSFFIASGIRMRVLNCGLASHGKGFAVGRVRALVLTGHAVHYHRPDYWLLWSGPKLNYTCRSAHFKLTRCCAMLLLVYWCQPIKWSTLIRLVWYPY